MANQTIYPFGTGGQLPSSIGIVNDLTTGGADKALSAEMGKRLGPLDDLIHNVTDTSSPTYTTGYKLSNYGWLVGGTAPENPNVTENSGGCWAKVAVKAGDEVAVWGRTGNADYLWVLCDEDRKILELGPKNGVVAEDTPSTITVTQDGWIYLSISGNYDSYGCVVSRAARALVKADSEHDGLMTKEHVNALIAVGSTDIDILKSYLIDTADVINVEYSQGKYYRNYNVSLGEYYSGTMEDASACFAAKIAVLVGDTVTMWAGEVGNTAYPYIVTNNNNKVVILSQKAAGATPYNIPQDNPAVIEITEDGWLYLSGYLQGGYGCTISRPKRAFYKATPERDGLMPKEIMALFGDGGSASNNEVSLKLKRFAFIGDSFSAPGDWQNTMCSDLGAIHSSNRAVSGGAWHGTNELSAYYQAGKLVESGAQFEYILCVLGTNDIAHWDSYTLGNIVNSETIGTESGNVNPDGSITGGIQATLIRLKNAFPNAVIKIGYTPAGYIHDSFVDISKVEQLCDRLKELSHIYGVGYIETRDCGICKWLQSDLHAYTGTTAYGEWTSTGHPSGAGQTRIGHYMARIMISNL